MADAPMTVVETAEFLKRAKGLMTDLEREALVAFVGANPEAGEVVPETGGVRKIRWALEGMGKRGGARNLLLPQRAPAAVLTLRIREEP
jgi:hypothetical protein